MHLKKFKLAPFYNLDKGWALLTCGEKNNYNAMTVSWGGMGTLWNSPVVTVYVKPIRYTYEFMETNDYFTLSFYDEEYRKDLSLLGALSGRDNDKIALTTLTPQVLDKGITFKEASITLVCKKIYYQDLDINNIKNVNDKEINRFYGDEPLHRMYIGEVIDIIDKR